MNGEREIRDRFVDYDLDLIGGKDTANLIRTGCGQLAIDFALNCPEGRELSLALTKLEEAMFWAKASIERRNNK